MKNKAYRAVSVKDVNLQEVILRLSAGSVWVGLDVGKCHTMVVVRDSAGSVMRPWKVVQANEIGVLVGLLRALGIERQLLVAMEPTGTYGEPLRQALCDAGLLVHRVSPKSTKDFSEVYDGVPSQHDGKDAAVVAELAAIGKSWAWPMDGTASSEMLHEVQWMNTQQDILQMWLGRLEALLARHWPELTSLLELNSSTLLQILAEYGGPQKLQAAADAREKLLRWSSGMLKSEKVELVLSSAALTTGVRMQVSDVEIMQRHAKAALTARAAIQDSRHRLTESVPAGSDLERVGLAIGKVTACVLFATVGNPRDYECGAAYRKAMGLNLKERSSGKYQGQLKITKRGPSIARRWLYFVALRMVQHESVKPWYERKKSASQQRGGKGIVAVMRKLCLAIHAVSRGATFDAGRLFPGAPAEKFEKV